MSLTPYLCPSCGSCIKHLSNYIRHIKRCGKSKIPCPNCEKVFSRQDVLKRHCDKYHPPLISTKEFVCETCHKGFCYESSLTLHTKICGKTKSQPFCCTFPGCGQCFTYKSNYTDHIKNQHQQLGGGVRKKKQQKLFKKVKQIYKVDKEVSMLKGLKVDAFFYPKTEAQQKDQQVFFKETFPRLQLYMKNTVKEKEGIKWNLMYHCSLSMPDKYREVPKKHSPYIRTPHPMTTTDTSEISSQLQNAMEMVEERFSAFMERGSGWTLEQNQALVLEIDTYNPF